MLTIILVRPDFRVNSLADGNFGNGRAGARIPLAREVADSGVAASAMTVRKATLSGESRNLLLILPRN